MSDDELDFEGAEVRKTVDNPPLLVVFLMMWIGLALTGFLLWSWGRL